MATVQTNDKTETSESHDTTQVVKPFPFESGKVSEEVSGNDSVGRKPRTPWTTGSTLKALAMIAVAVVLLVLLFQSCGKDEATKADIAALKIDIADVKKSVTAVDNAGNIASVADVAQDIHRNMVKKTDLTGLAKSDDLSALAKSSDLTGLAKQSDLSGLATTSHLRRVERKLDAHMATKKVDQNDNRVPVVVQPKVTVVVPQPTHNVTIRRVPTYVDVYKPRSAP